MKVVVCGAGMSGMSAALTAAQAGADVTVLEKGPAVGGSARMSSGNIWTAVDMDAVRSLVPHGNPVLQAVVVERFEESVAWLIEQGVHCGEKRPLTDYGHGWKSDPAQVFSALLERAVAAGVDARTETSLDALRTDGTAVTGVEVVSEAGAEAIDADAVVLATGGFQGNAELLRRYCLPSTANVYHRSNPWSTGDGFLAATAVGAAASAGMESFYGHAMIAPPAPVPPNDFPEVTQYEGVYAVALNLAGRRFVDESLGTGEEVLNQSLARQPDGRGVYVLDAKVAARACLPPDWLMTSVVLERALARGAAISAGSLDELVDGLGRFGVNVDAARATLRHYNESVQDAPLALDPLRANFTDPLTEPPFYAVAVKAAITFTAGGLAVDEQMRVLRRTRSSSPLAELIRSVDEYRPVPIPGLYAAGCDVGNIHNVGYLGGLATALTTGRRAGQAAAGKTV